MDWSDFHFLRPYWFLALIPLAFLVWRFSHKTLSQVGWKGVIDEALLPYVLADSNENQTSHSKKSYLKLFISLVGIIAIVALAGPVFERLPQPVYRNDTALVIALDLSRSMDADDLKPSRLARARFKIADLLKQRKDGQTALLVYAGESFVVTPLTDDAATILSQLKALTTDLMPVQGNRADKALLKASELLQQAGAGQGDVLLITDGVTPSSKFDSSDTDFQRVITAAEKLKSRQYRLFVMGLGTKEGAPIKLPSGGYLTDAEGNIVIPALQEKGLKRLAGSVDGIYQRYTRSDNDVNRLSLLLDVKPDENKAASTDLSVERWREEGPWLLLLLLPFAALAFRKGALLIVPVSLASLVSVTSLIYMPEAEAADLWRRSDQIAAELLEQGDAAKAASEFEDQRWKASAQYKAGDYQGALESWSTLEPDQDDHSGYARDLYNMGNAQVKVGDYPGALESYKQALQKQPEFEDAQYNYDLVKKALEKQQQSEDQKNQDKKDKQEGDQEQKKNQGDEQSDQEKQKSEDSPGQEDGQEGDQGGEQDQEQQSSSQDQSENNEPGKNSPGKNSQEKNKQEETDQEKDSSKQQESDQQNEEQQAESGTQLPESISEESQQALEQWLRRIPDDPGGLLRRKFIYQYKRQQQAKDERNNQNSEQQW